MLPSDVQFSSPSLLYPIFISYWGFPTNHTWPMDFSLALQFWGEKMILFLVPSCDKTAGLQWDYKPLRLNYFHLPSLGVEH